MGPREAVTRRPARRRGTATARRGRTGPSPSRRNRGRAGRHRPPTRRRTPRRGSRPGAGAPSAPGRGRGRPVRSGRGRSPPRRAPGGRFRSDRDERSRARRRAAGALARGGSVSCG
ncbi:MAG: hypothetical protein COT28_00655 [Methylobacterium sp. CG08_land_8_20_14_0_20_71_15]|nr:MAG: hypothetical protein COT56_11890 [Methylobacterium sp. CG09_land_8_20_14_0_10_71_15]PIU16485.1 MAG: hypothetical protein COT28_00655 [Methylobacterium sp. CG08_land_8_20_14_0_20_71_15]